MRRLSGLTLMVVLFLSVLMACGDGDMSSLARVSEDFSYNYPLAEGGEIEVTSRNGTVEILGWEQDQVEINGSKYANSREELDGIKINIEATENRLQAKAEFPNNSRGGKGARFVIRAPSSARVRLIDTSNGSIRVEGVARVDMLDTSNASISVIRSHGPLVADTSNGAIRIVQTPGDLKLDTSNGRIEADDVTGSIDADTSNGRIRVSVSDPAPKAAMRFDTTNGGIEVTMQEFRDNPMTIDTSNGNVTLRLPDSTNAEVHADTSNGSIRTDFALPSSSGNRRKELRGQLGNGGALIRVSSTNGTVQVLKN
jgi:DUF4097 and DUF4098 domain-containing protein YvlB